MSPTARPTAFTLIELLVVMSVIAILMTVLIPVANMVRNQAKKATAARMVAEISMAFDDYRDSDPRHLFPAPNPAEQDPVTMGYYLDRDPSAPISLFIELETQQSLAAKAFHSDNVGKGYQTPSLNADISSPYLHCLMDPWGRPYRYWLDGAYVTAAHVMDTHLMNGAADRPAGVTAAFAAAGVTMDWNPAAVEPAAYIWSSGVMHGSSDELPANAPNWIYNKSGQ